MRVSEATIRALDSALCVQMDIASDARKARNKVDVLDIISCGCTIAEDKGKLSGKTQGTIESINAVVSWLISRCADYLEEDGSMWQEDLRTAFLLSELKGILEGTDEQ